MGWWVYDIYHTDPMLLVAWVVWVIGSICLHELGHGVAAIKLGDRTPIEFGHMTWNPLVHMGRMSLLIFVIVGIAWGAMPVNPSRMRGRYADTWVSLAGPAVNLALACICIVVVALWQMLLGHTVLGSSVPALFAKNFDTFFYAGAFLNIALFIFNLVPAPPLDGSRILADLVPGYRRLFFEDERGAMLGLGLLVLLFVFGADVVFMVASDTTVNSIQFLVSLVPSPATP